MRLLRIAFCAVAFGLCGAAGAENRPLPDLFDVTGVAAVDALNVRSAPDAQAEIMGALDSDATDVEITAIQGGWGRVNQGERSGWTAMRFLSRQDDTWMAGAIPPALVCFGTEPFWSLGFEDDDMVWSSPDETRWIETAEVLGGAIPGDVRRGLVAAGDGKRDQGGAVGNRGVGVGFGLEQAEAGGQVTTLDRGEQRGAAVGVPLVGIDAGGEEQVEVFGVAGGGGFGAV